MASAVRSARRPASGSCIRWPSYPITPRTAIPARRARSASAAASAWSQPHLGRPTSTSMSTSLMPPEAAASTVSGESTATVTRAVPVPTRAPSRRVSSTSLASSRSSPNPAAAMPSISRTVAQQKPWWPAEASRVARAVHLKALTWGRRVEPGRATDMAATLWSSTDASASRAGVVRSPARMVCRPALVAQTEVARASRPGATIIA